MSQERVLQQSILSKEHRYVVIDLRSESNGAPRADREAIMHRFKDQLIRVLYKVSNADSRGEAIARYTRYNIEEVKGATDH